MKSSSASTSKLTPPGSPGSPPVSWPLTRAAPASCCCHLATVSSAARSASETTRASRPPRSAAFSDLARAGICRLRWRLAALPLRRTCSIRSRSPVPVKSCQRARISPRSSDPFLVASSNSASAAPVRAVGLGSQLGLQADLGLHGLGQRRNPGAERVEHAGHGLGQDRDPPFLLHRRLIEPLPDRAVDLGRQHPVGENGLGDHETLRSGEPVGLASIASKCELSCRADSGRTRDSTMASDASRSLACCSSSQTAASA